MLLTVQYLYVSLGGGHECRSYQSPNLLCGCRGRCLHPDPLEYLQKEMNAIESNGQIKLVCVFSRLLS